MPKKFAVITALALSTVVAGAGIASAGGNGGGNGGNGSPTTVKGGEDFSSGPHVMTDSPAVVNVNGNVVDAACVLPWANGAAGIAGVLAKNPRYVACNADKVDQSHDGEYISGLL
ncbi:hypothetical protein [Streptomyces coerulescens]|uniref:Secreted protein n=1 Tax=Streptomyces coerulescens TaxID=29304 RepID=A0ABW0CQR1_STRCD